MFRSMCQSKQNYLLFKDQQKLKNSCVMPKLRTYNLIAEFSSPKAYLLKPLSFLQRKSVAKLRLGVLPIRQADTRGPYYLLIKGSVSSVALVYLRMRFTSLWSVQGTKS